MCSLVLWPRSGVSITAGAMQLTRTPEPATSFPIDLVTPITAAFHGGDDIGISGTHDISFHDRRGLIVDPVAVAALLADLMLFRPALVAAGAGGSASQPGGVSTIANIAGPAVRVHVVSPH